MVFHFPTHLTVPTSLLIVAVYTIGTLAVTSILNLWPIWLSLIFATSAFLLLEYVSQRFFVITITSSMTLMAFTVSTIYISTSTLFSNKAQICLIAFGHSAIFIFLNFF